MADHVEPEAVAEQEDEQEPELEAVVVENRELDRVEEEEDEEGHHGINVGHDDDEEEEEECRSSATPTQDDNASPIEGQPASLSHQPSLVSSLAPVDMDEIPLPVETDEIPLPSGVGSFLDGDAVVDVSDGDLDDDGGGDNTMVMIIFS